MLLCIEWVNKFQKDYDYFSYLNPQTTQAPLPESIYYEAFDALYYDGLRGHAKQSNDILLRWLNNDLVKANYQNPDYPEAA